MPFFKLKCEGLHPIHCLKQMFVTFSHTLKWNLEWIPDLTTLTNLRRFQILLFPPKRYLSLQSWGTKKLKKGKISTVHFKVNNFLQGTPWLEDLASFPLKFQVQYLGPFCHIPTKWLSSITSTGQSSQGYLFHLPTNILVTRLFLKTELKPVSEAYHQRHSFYTHSLDHS